MWNKVKTFFSIVGAVLSIALLTIVLLFLRRGNSDRRRSRENIERDTRIQEGFGNVTESIRNSRDTAGRCEEHLQRAEGILREAINRSRKEK